MGRCIMIAGGGTGGHIMPAIALAEEIMDRYADIIVWYVGRCGSMEEKWVEATRFHFCAIHAAPLKKSLSALVRCAVSTCYGIAQSWRLIRKHRPGCIIGFGGYAAFPLMLAGRLMRIPVVVHEANAVPGKTVRLLVRFGAALAYGIDAGHPALAAVQARAARRHAVQYTGIPVRRIRCDARAEEGYKETQFSPDLPVLLVTGGSQGAHFLNTLMCAAVPSIAARHPEIQIVHITGKNDEEMVRSAYEKAHITHYVTHFTPHMGAFAAMADCAVTRAGAVTIAELSVHETPSICVPYPYATDDHQYWNASAVVRAGAGMCLREDVLTGEVITDIVCHLIEAPEQRAAMAVAARSFHHRDARTSLCAYVMSHYKENAA